MTKREIITLLKFVRENLCWMGGYFEGLGHRHLVENIKRNAYDITKIITHLEKVSILEPFNEQLS